MQIRFIRENKGECLKAIEPQAIHNRFDLKEGWTPMESVNAYVDISDVAERKFAVLGLYESQLGWIKYPERVEGLNKYRGMMLANNVKYAEAFKVWSVGSCLWGRK